MSKITMIKITMSKNQDNLYYHNFFSTTCQNHAPKIIIRLRVKLELSYRTYNLFLFSKYVICDQDSDLFGLCPFHSLVGAYYLHPREARAILLHNDLLCNGCYMTIYPMPLHPMPKYQMLLYPMPKYQMPLYPIHIDILFHNPSTN